MNRLAAIRNEPRAPQAPAIAPPHRSRLGYGLIAAACLFWGFSASLGRAAFTGRLLPGSAISRLNPTILSQARATFSFLALFAVLAAIRGIRSLRLPWTAVGRMFLLGVVGVAPSNYFYYLAIQRTNVATAIILQYTAPVWVLIYMVARGREKLELARFISVLLAIAGIALVLGVLGRGRLHFDKLGVLAALIAAFSFAFYNVYGHCLLGHYDRWTVLLYTTCSASVLWGMVHPPRATVGDGYTPQTWLFLFCFAVFSVLIPFAFYFAGLERLDPTSAIVTGCLEPVFTILIAALSLREGVTPLQGLGMALVLMAIVIIQKPAPRPEK